MSDPLAARVVSACRDRALTVATCESLTAGLVAATLAQVPGASNVLRGGLVTYATDLKARLAGVDAGLLAERGAVDAEVAAQMARGTRRECGADFGLSCTGVAGPEPQDGQPVGTVFIGIARGDSPADTDVERLSLSGDRDEIRTATVASLFTSLLSHLGR